MTNSSGRTVTLGAWLADGAYNGREVTRIDSFYVDTEALLECCHYVDTLGRNVTMGYEVSPLEKLGFYVISRHLGYKNSEEVVIAHKEFLEEHIKYYEGFSYNKNSFNTEDSKEFITRWKNSSITEDRKEYLRSVADYAAEAYKKGRERK